MPAECAGEVRRSHPIARFFDELLETFTLPNKMLVVRKKNCLRNSGSSRTMANHYRIIGCSFGWPAIWQPPIAAIPGFFGIYLPEPMEQANLDSLTRSKTRVLKSFAFVYCATTAGGIWLFMIAGAAPMLFSAR